MNRISLQLPVFLLTLFASFHLFAQTPQWSWVKGANSANIEIANSVAHDPVSGGVVVVGSWAGDISADIPGLSTSAGGKDGFVAKYAPDGTVTWAFPIGGTGSDEIMDVAIDDVGNIYIVGTFENTTAFRGTTPFPNAIHNSNGSGDGFIAKYTSAGVLIWIEQMFCTQLTVASSVALGPNGVYVTGWYGTSSFTIGGITLNNIGSNDFFTTKLTTAGVPIWARRGGGSLGPASDERGESICADANRVYIGGTFESTTITFDGAGLLTNSSSGFRDIFYAALDETNGNVVWAQRIGGTDHDLFGDIEQDATGLYLTGGINDNGTVVNFPGGLTRTTGSTGIDIFMTRATKATGLTNWVRVEQNGSNSNSMGHAVAVDGNGAAYFAGDMSGTTDFTGINLVANGADIFVAAYESNTGNILWAKGEGAAQEDRAYGLDTVTAGYVYACGIYTNAVTFDTVPTLPANTGANIWTGRVGNIGHIAVTDSVCVPFETATSLDVQANEINQLGDSLTTQVIIGPTRGMAAVSNGDSILYTPMNGFTGLDSLLYSTCATSGFCDSAWALLSVGPVANAGPDTMVCGAAYFLAGNNPFPGTGTWSIVAGPGSVSTPGQFNSPFFGFGPGASQLEWTTNVLGCETRDSVFVAPDTVPPSITCPPNDTVVSGALCTFVTPNYIGAGVATDNCPPVTITQSLPVASVQSASAYNLWLYATDLAGNVDSCSFSYVVAANINPTVVSCGTKLVGETTIGAGNNESNFSCVGFNTPGEDQFYQITVPSGNYWIQLTMDNVSDANDAEVDVFWIGNSCPLGGSCISRSSFLLGPQRFAGTGTNRERFLASGPGTFFLAVDSRTDGIDSYDIAFDCVKSGITFDTTGCAGDPDANGFNPTVNAAHGPLEVTPCQTVDICHTLFIGNPIDIEWIDSVTFDLGTCYTNVVPATPIAGFYAPGNWVGAYNAGNQKINWEFNNTSNPAFGDGNALIPYNCDSLTFCFTADIAASCDTNPNLNVAISIFDDGVGGAGATASSVDDALSDMFMVVDPPPMITCPPNITQDNDFGLCSAIINGIPASVNDNCPGPAITYILAGATIGTGNTDASGTAFNQGITNVTYTVTDVAGNIRNCVFTVTVNDTSPPTLICIADTTVLPNMGCMYALPDLTTTAIGLGDNCAVGILVTQSPAPGAMLGVNTPITLTANDGFGNVATCSFNVIINLTGTIPDAGPDTSICGDQFTLMGNLPVTGTGNWAFLSGGGALTNSADPTTLVTTLTPGLNVLSWTIANGSCTQADTVEILVTLAPVITMGPDDTVCGPVGQLNAGVLSSGVGSWAVVQGSGIFGNPAAPLTAVNVLGIGANQFSWTITDGACVEADTVEIFSYDSVNVAAGISDTLCGLSGTLLAGTPIVGSGTWTVLSGTGILGTPNLASTGVAGLSPGLNEFRWTVQNGLCGDSARYSLLAFAPVTADPGLPDTVCGPNTVLTGVGPIAGTGSWTVLAGTGVLQNIALPTSAVTNLTPGGNLFEWSVMNGRCVDTAVVEVFSYDSVTALAGPNDTVCGTSGNLMAIPPPVGTGNWTTIGGTGSLGTPNLPATSVVGLGAGLNTFQWRVQNGTCLDSATATLFSNALVAANAGPNDTVCGPTIQLNAAPPAVGTGTWSVVTGTGVFINPNDPATSVSGMGAGTNQLQWTIQNGSCTDFATVEVFVFDSVQANAGVNDTTCGPDGVLTAVTPTLGTGAWTALGSGPMIASGFADSTSVTGLTLGGNEFQWVVTNGLCADTSTVELFSLAFPTADAGPTDSVCGTDAMLTGVASAGSMGTWSVLSGSGAFSNAGQPATMVIGLSLGLNQFVWKVNNGVCSDSSSVEIYAFAPVTAQTMNDTSICIDEAQLDAQPISSGSGNWIVLSGSGTLSGITQSSTLVTGLSAGNNLFQWAVLNGPCTASDSVQIFYADEVAVAGPDLEICEGDTAKLMADVNQSGIWSVASGFTSLGSLNSPNSFVFDAIPGITELIWSWDNGACVTMDTTLLVTIQQPDLANAGPDQFLQPGVTATLAGNDPLIGTGQWTQVGGPTALTFLQGGLWNTTVSGFASGGSYVLGWEISHGNCPPSMDEMVIEVLGFVVPQVVTPNDDQKNDTWEILGLDNYGTVKVTILNRWGNPVFVTDDYQNDWAGTNQEGKLLSDDTYFYVLELPKDANRPEAQTEFKGFLVIKR